MATTSAATTLTPDCINFVNKHNAWRCFLSPSKQIADAAGTHTHKHLHEFGSTNMKERHVRLTTHRARHQSLTSAWRAHQQHAFRDLRAQISKLLWRLQELDDLAQFLLRFRGTCHFRKRHAIFLVGRLFHISLTKSHRLTISSLHLAQKEPQHRAKNQHEQQRRQQITHERRQSTWLLHLNTHGLQLFSCDAVTSQNLVQRLGTFFVRQKLGVILARNRQRILLHVNTLNLTGLNLSHQGANANSFRGFLATHVIGRENDAKR